MARRSQRISSRYSTPVVVSRRKPTVLGSHKLHQLLKKARDNKVITAAITSVVVSIAAMFISSKGGYLESWNTMRNALKSVPGGHPLSKLLQRIMDSIRRMLGLGIVVGDVVEPCNNDGVLFAKNSLDCDDGSKVPSDEDYTYSKYCENISNDKFIVAHINTTSRTFTAIKKTDEHEDTGRAVIKKLIAEANKEKKDVEDSKLIRFAEFDFCDNLKNPKRTDPVHFQLDHFKKSKTNEQFKNVGENE